MVRASSKHIGIFNKLNMMIVISYYETILQVIEFKMCKGIPVLMKLSYEFEIICSRGRVVKATD